MNHAFIFFLASSRASQLGFGSLWRRVFGLFRVSPLLVQSFHFFPALYPEGHFSVSCSFSIFLFFRRPMSTSFSIFLFFRRPTDWIHKSFYVTCFKAESRENSELRRSSRPAGTDSLHKHLETFSGASRDARTKISYKIFFEIFQ